MVSVARSFPSIGDGMWAAPPIIPIFSGLLIQNQIAEAKATLDVVKANTEVLKQQSRLYVGQTCSNLREASDRIGQTQLIVRQAKRIWPWPMAAIGPVWGIRSK
jgi:outer membrane protein TolC